MNPMIPRGIFRSRPFTLANVLTLFLYAALAEMFFIMPMDLIQVQRYSATLAGAAIVPFSIIMFVLSRWSGGLVARVGSRMPLTIGPLDCRGGFALLALSTSSVRSGPPFFRRSSSRDSAWRSPLRRSRRP